MNFSLITFSHTGFGDDEMITLQGKYASNGVAIGRLQFLPSGKGEVVRRHVEDVEAEVARVVNAAKNAIEGLKSLYEKAVIEVGETGAQLFEIHQMMLKDDDYRDSVHNIIRLQQVNAEYAVAMTCDNFAKMFSQMDDDYMKERAADVRDVSDRLIAVLSSDMDFGCANTSEPSVIAAEDLSPSETVQLDKDKILAFVTAGGATNSHTSILARAMSIPAVVCAENIMKAGYNGCAVIVDGGTGTVYINPDEETLALMQKKQSEAQTKRTLLEQLKGNPNVTLDGKEIMVYANIGRLSDLGGVLQNDAGGIGLFRTEFLYLESSDFPTEEEQFQVYKTVTETMAGKRVIFRTLDIGADKQAGYFGLPKEENPALGMRAIRICLTRPEILKTQLRALYRASAFGKVAIMFPMIVSLWEVQKAKEILDEVLSELAEQDVPFSKNTEIGIMIETPAAAIISDLLAKEVDFFSIGANDLIQYTLAADRQNQNIERFSDPHHEAVLRLIQMTAQSAHKAGIWVGICGELAADLTLTEQFPQMGIDELSVSPSSVLPLREKITQSRCAI
jgi:phosphotransferase system enzyme I (PtsI)